MRYFDMYSDEDQTRMSIHGHSYSYAYSETYPTETYPECPFRDTGYSYAYPTSLPIHRHWLIATATFSRTIDEYLKNFHNSQNVLKKFLNKINTI